MARDADTSFDVEDLQPTSGAPDHLRHVTSEAVASFAVALTYVVLINQVVHSHFRELHAIFRARTRYPLIVGGMNPSRSPYDILTQVDWLSRGATYESLVEGWNDLIAQLGGDVVSYLTGPGKDDGITWDAFRGAMLSDVAVVGPVPWGPAIGA